MPKNKHSNLIASVKTPNLGFINKYIINSEIKGKGGGGLFSVSQLPITSLKYLSISLPPQLVFFIKYRQNKLLRLSF